MENSEYVKALEDQCREWENMYNDLKSENEQLKKRIDTILHGASPISDRSRQAQIRHV